MRSKTRAFAALSALCALVVACSGAGSTTTTGIGGTTTSVEGSSVIELVIAHTVSQNDALHIEAIETAKRIEERAGGRVKIEVFANGQMGGFGEMIERVERGENLITQQIPGFAVDYGVPELEVLTAPFIFEGYDDIKIFIESDLFQGWQQRLHGEGIKTFDWNWYFGKRHIVANEGYPEPEDLQGVSIRVPTTPMWVLTFEALPTTPVTIEFAELFTALEQGVVDAAEMPIFALETMGFAELVEAVTLTGHFDNLNTWAMNAELFDSLPADIQQILDEEFGAGGERQTQRILDDEAAIRARLEQSGVRFFDANLEAYRAMTASVYDKFEAWPDDLYEQVQHALGR